VAPSGGGIGARSIYPANMRHGVRKCVVPFAFMRLRYRHSAVE
jgi:hypothetical protein